MKKSILYLLVVTITAITGCQKDPDVEVAVRSSNSLTVALPTNSATTKVEYSDTESGVNLSWEETDKIAIYTADGDFVSAFQYSSLTTDGNANFVSVTSQTTLSDGNDYIALFPAIEGAITLEQYNLEFENIIAEQTQTGNNDSHHLNNAQRMEAEFTYSVLNNVNLTFEHKMASVRIAFVYGDLIPHKVIFRDGEEHSYILNFEDVTETSSYTAYLVVNPNLEGLSRELLFEIYDDESSDSTITTFTATSDAIYSAGVQYRLTLASAYLDMNIYTKNDLITFQELVNGGNIYINAVLMNDIDLDGIEWTPIGSSSNKYSGIFDGGGYTISNLTINSSSDYQGLFGYINSISISNLTIENPQIRGGNYVGALSGYAKSIGYNYVYDSALSGYVKIYTSCTPINNCNVVGGSVYGNGNYVGGIAGYAYSTLISCYNTSSVSSSGNYVGGIIGYAASSSIFTSCYNTGSISGVDYVGGIIGYATSSSVASCYNTGSVSSDGNNVGGIIGYAASSSTFTSCYNAGSVSSADYVGGIVGRSLSSTFTSCYNTGSVSSRGDIGGVVGFYSSSTFTTCYYVAGVNYTYGTKLTTLLELNNVVETMNSAAGGEYFTVNSGNILPSLLDEQITYEDKTCVDNAVISTVEEFKAFRDLVNFDPSWAPTTATLTADIDLNGEEWTPISVYMGAFDGGGHTISNLTINGSGDCIGMFGSINGGSISNLIIKNPQIQGDRYVGAICGFATSSSEISRCCVIGGSISGQYSIGGVVGESYSTTLISSYNTGSVLGNSSSGGVGGVIGCADSSTITSCYNAGSVSGSNNYIGGVIGYYASASSLSACYFIDIENDNANAGVGISSSSYSYMTLSSVSELNSVVPTMNTTAGEIYYTAGDPADTYLPSLFGESIKYE